MAVVLPSGWTGFQGGGSNPALCGEDESGVIPPIDVRPQSGQPEALDCSDAIYEIQLEAIGGVAPFTWETTEGQIEATGLRTATLRINQDPAGPIVVDNVSNNPCGVAAYIYRGRAIFADTSITPGANPCTKESCVGIVFNCKGEILAGSFNLNGSVGSVFCDPEYEDQFVENMDDHQAVNFGYAANYANCTRYPEGWPAVCLQTIPAAPPDPSWACFGSLPTCPDDIYGTRIYPSPGHCEDGTDGVGSGSGIDPKSYLVLNPGSGLCDVRHPATIAAGCSPCVLLKDTDIVVTARDARGIGVAIVIHVN